MAWNRKSTSALLIAALLCAAPAVHAADEPVRHHALSLIGAPKHPPGFTHFRWVNPEAPKGGRIRQWAMGTFDSLNPFTVKGSPEQRLDLLQTTLMTGTPDEESTVYGYVAEWVSYPDDFSSATFGIRKEARFSDGSAITPEDVAFSLGALKAAHPRYGYYYKNVVSAEKTGERQVTFKFDTKGNRELPLIISELPVLSKAYWTGTGANGEPRDLTKTTLEIPVTSGPYRIKEVEAGRGITYERIKDWWAKDLPVTKGQWNFDELRITYFRDRVPAFEAFKSGEIDYWRENSAKAWATGFEFDAVKRGQIKLEKLPVKSVAPMQAFAFNLRRPQFQDARVRRAFNLAFDFEWANKNLFYDQYTRVGSYFDNSELKATGLPVGKELEILESVRADVPAEVFTTEWKNPVNKSPEDFRRHLSQAARLLAEAGWTAKDGVLTNAKGEKLEAEFLLVQPDFERLVLPLKNTLEKLGVSASVRIVDVAQYQRRNETFNFDIMVASFPQSLSPGNEQRNFWGSAAASHDGSRNVIGIKNPAIDKLIERLVLAQDREELVAITRALDRVLLWNFYLIPQWHLPFERLALWDKFGRPSTLPERGSAFFQTWWYDEAAAKRLANARN